jgi:Fe-S oxidoreductase
VLTPPEKLVFLLAALTSALLTCRGFHRLYRVIRRGRNPGGSDQGDRTLLPRLAETLSKTLTLRTVFRTRPLSGIAHALVAWCYFFYLVVNLGDGLQGFLPRFVFLGEGPVGELYHLLGDLLSAGALIGITTLLVRRFVVQAAELEIGRRQSKHDPPLLHSHAVSGIRRDSAIVGAFILMHVGARFLGESFRLAQTGPHGWQPFASLASRLWGGWGSASLEVARHATWWVAFGLILLFLPYFPYSKHIHLFFAPLNFLLKPRRVPRGARVMAPGQMEPIPLDGEVYGAARLEELPWAQLMDAFACVQCNRCQEVCPATAAGTALSPSALEVNKRYQLNEEGGEIARGKPSRHPLLETVLREDAVWACTSCGACAEICPVGNAPLQDILEIRRHQTLMEGRLPHKGAAALRNIAVLGNPWGGAPSGRMDWTNGLGVRTMREVGQADVLYWVGCSSAYEGRNQEIARAVVRLLQKAEVDFAILGEEERCTGDPARRMGDEALFQKMARHNLATLSRYSFRRIVTHCSHCYHVLKNEYPALMEPPARVPSGATDGRTPSVWEVVHHTQLLSELVTTGRLRPAHEINQVVTFHDSCYLGRYNGEFEAPRGLLAALPGVELKEMPRSRANGLCCGGGGGCSWVDVPAERRVADIRMEEALTLKPGVVASACPFCLTMFEGSALKGTSGVQLKDVAELLDEATGGSP